MESQQGHAARPAVQLAAGPLKVYHIVYGRKILLVFDNQSVQMSDLVLKIVDDETEQRPELRTESEGEGRRNKKIKK